ncbi:hypothetical protein HN587_01005 [Candidatus Woesearchaeota archaeon]|nr:hypothetical protein [Candidatus Woesearchaeota archaeon]
MGDKKPVINLRINYKDVFSVKGLYKMVHFWLVENGYCNDSNDKWIEKLFVERVSNNGMKEMWMWWRTDKSTDSMFKFYFNVDFHFLGITTTEIMYEGKKFKSNSGEIDLEFFTFIEFDPSGKWDDHFILSNSLVKNWWRNKAYKDQFDKKAEELYKDAYRLHSAISQYLDLKAFLHEYQGKPFHPKKGPTA